MSLNRAIASISEKLFITEGDRSSLSPTKIGYLSVQGHRYALEAIAFG
ncbi:hypothetical protein [Nostoc sp.]